MFLSEGLAERCEKLKQRQAIIGREIRHHQALGVVKYLYLSYVYGMYDKCVTGVAHLANEGPICRPSFRFWPTILSTVIERLIQTPQPGPSRIPGYSVHKYVQ